MQEYRILLLASNRRIDGVPDARARLAALGYSGSDKGVRDTVGNLVAKGLLTSYKIPSRPLAGGQLLRGYQITPAGREAIAETDRLNNLARGA